MRGKIHRMMTSTLVHLRIAQPLMTEVTAASERQGFSSVQEYMKHALREQAKLDRREEEKRVRQALKDLSALKGSVHITPKSKQEFEKFLLQQVKK